MSEMPRRAFLLGSGALGIAACAAPERDLLEAYELMSPRVEIHLVGLRGAALRLEGRDDEARELLMWAAGRAPNVWGDGALTARELL